MAKAKPKPKSKKPSSKPAGGGKKRRRWSQHVTETSDALDLQGGVFAGDDPKKIAQSLKHSAEDSTRRKSSPFRSAMSMLTFFINRGGKNLNPQRRRVLNQAKEELRRAFDRE